MHTERENVMVSSNDICGRPPICVCKHWQ